MRLVVVRKALALSISAFAILYALQIKELLLKKIILNLLNLQFPLAVTIKSFTI